jgi:voltage-gated potassium channel Kch
MHFNILIAACLIVVTTAIHGGAMMLTMQAIRKHEGKGGKRSRLKRINQVSGIVILLFLASLLEVLVWASTYLALNAIQGFERALYFSMVTYTTLGYGDIVLPESWRLLGSFEAAIGIIMFGWTTAIVIAAVTRIYFREETERHRHADKP